jgi:hypothetical protein
MPDETIFAYGHKLAYESMALQAASGTYHNTFLYLTKRADENELAERAFIKVARLHDCNVRSSIHIAYRRLIVLDFIQDSGSQA